MVNVMAWSDPCSEDVANLLASNLVDFLLPTVLKLLKDITVQIIVSEKSALVKPCGLARPPGWHFLTQ